MMDYVYQTIDSERLTGIFNLPSSLIGKTLEVIILPARDNTEPIKKKKSAFGCLRQYANPELIPLEKGAWERMVVEEYGDS
jgi:hypothetical protein